MNSPHPPTRPTTRASQWIVALAAFASLAACGAQARSYRLQSQVGPAPKVHGSIQLEPIDGGQQLVLLQIQDLPPPERLASGRRSYVVWLSPDEDAPQLAGALHYDPARRSGNLLLMTSLSRFVLRITAERSAAPQHPSDLLVAQRSVAATGD